MPTNFALYERITDFSVQYETASNPVSEFINESQSDHYGVQTVPVDTSVSPSAPYFDLPYWQLNRSEGIAVNGLYFEHFNGSIDAINENYSVNFRDVSAVNDVVAENFIGNKALAVPTTSELIETVEVFYRWDSDAPEQRDLLFTGMHVLGTNLADSITTGYSDGRKYQYNEPLRLQKTKTQAYSEKPASFPKKDFLLKNLSEDEQIECLDFFERNQGKLVLMVEYGASNRHHYTLGFLDATTNTSQFYNVGEMGFSITQKHAVT